MRAIDQRYLSRWDATRRKPAFRQMGVDDIFVGRKQKFITVVSNLETAEPLWFEPERKKETLDEFFPKQLIPFQRGAVRAACMDIWEPFRRSQRSGSRKPHTETARLAHAMTCPAV